jgi:hypothetical protein
MSVAATTVFDALDAVGILPNAGVYARARAEFMATGRVLMAELDIAELLLEAMDKLGTPIELDDIVRVLGLGEATTLYLTAPLGHITARTAQQARAGALANLIVGLYDRFIDDPGAALPPLSRDVVVAHLGRLVSTPSAPPPISESRDPATRLFEFLLIAYVDAVAPIVSGPRAEHLVGLILRMFDAEELTRLSGQPPLAVLLTKSVLPFVVMAAPGGPAPRAHQVWLRRCAGLMGWLDDVIDREADHARGHANITARLAGSSIDGSQLAGLLAARALRVQTYWQATVAQPDSYRLAVRELLGVSILSWFGGSRPSPDFGSYTQPAAQGGITNVSGPN